MSRLRTALGVGGGVVTLLSLLAVFAPSLLLSIPAMAGWIDALAAAHLRVLLAVCSLALALVVLWLARSARSEHVLATDEVAERRMAAVRRSPPETVGVEQRTLTGAFLDARVGRAVAGDDESLRTVRSRLSDVAAAVLVADAEYDRASAERAVATGEWTDDPTAAAFLAVESDGPVASLLARLRLWLDPESERERRVRRTVTAIERLRGEES